MKNVITYIIACCFLISCAEKLEKKIVSTYPNGTPMLINYLKVINGKKVIAKETRFFPNGEKSSEGEWTSDSKKTGTWKQWFPNGKKWIEESYKDGKKDGESSVWVDNGNKLYEGEFKEDKPTGTWKYYDENGKITKKELLK
jgi:antitoxin component YwqK of YwqJK toxin-antitoxin module